MRDNLVITDVDGVQKFGKPSRHGKWRRWSGASLIALGAGLCPLVAAAQCSQSGSLAPGSVVTCAGTQSVRVGQGPGADHVSVTANDGATIAVTDDNAISLGDGGTITLGSGTTGSAPVLLQTTTDAAATTGQYNDGDNTIDVGSNNTITINRNASVVTSGPQRISEAINTVGSGNTILNYGLIRGQQSSAIFFQNVNTNAASPVNTVDNFGTIEVVPVGADNPITGGDAVGSLHNVGIDFINETGAKVIANLIFQDGNDTLTINPGSSISGIVDGGGGDNTVVLNAQGTASGTATGVFQDFQNLNKTGSGTWTLTGAIGDQTVKGPAPLAVSVIGGTLVLTGDNSAFDGTVAINPGSTAGSAGADPSATLEAQTQSLPGLISDQGILEINQASADGVYDGLVQGTGGLTKTGAAAVTLNTTEPYAGPTNVDDGTLAVGDATHSNAALSGGGAVLVGPGAALTGYGSVAGTVTNDGTVGAANALAPLSGGADGSFTVDGGLLNNGLVDVASTAAPGNDLVVKGNYTSTGGTVELATVLNAGGALANQITDRLLIDGNASGTTVIKVNATGTGAITSQQVGTAGSGISLVQVAGSSSAGAFTLAGGFVTGGTAFQYRLAAYGPGSARGPADASQSLVGNAGQQWDYRLQDVSITPGGTPTVPPAGGTTAPGGTPSRLAVAPQVAAYISAPQALFSAGFNDIDELHRRLGEIRADDAQGNAAETQTFVRVFGSSFNYSSNRHFAAYGYNMTGDDSAVQFGATRRVVDDEDGTLRLGLAGNFGQVWFVPAAVDGQSKGSFSTKTIAATATWQARAGWYVDGIVSGGVFNGQVSTATGKATDLNGSSVAASVEVGDPIPLGAAGLVAEPEAQVIYEHLDFGRKTDVNGIDVALGSPNEGLVRAGSRLLRVFTLENGFVLTPYVEANVLHGIGGGGSVHLSNTAFETGDYGTAVQVRAGMTGQLSQALSVYGDVARTQDVGNSGFRGWAFNGGIKYSF